MSSLPTAREIAYDIPTTADGDALAKIIREDRQRIIEACQAVVEGDPVFVTLPKNQSAIQFVLRISAALDKVLPPEDRHAALANPKETDNG